MAGKKYKPALYELIDKGRVKPDKKGTLGTPKWFFHGKDKSQPVQPKFVSATAARPVAAARTDTPAVARKTEPAGRWSFFRQITGNIDWQRFKIKSSYKVAGIVGIVATLLVCVLANYIYKGFAGNKPPEMTQQAPLASVRTGPVTPGMIPAQATNTVPAINRPGNVVPVDPAQPARPISGVPLAATSQVRTATGERVMPAVAEPIPAPALSAVPLSGNTLIICSNDQSQDALSGVQEFFGQKGIKTGLGRFTDRYVLFTLQTYPGLSDAGLKKLKESVTQLGSEYNRQKPKGAVSYAFDTAYPVKVEKIEKIGAN